MSNSFNKEKRNNVLVSSLAVAVSINYDTLILATQ